MTLLIGALRRSWLGAMALTPIVATASAQAQEITSLNGMSAVNAYMNQQDVDRFRAWESKNQVTSVNQFSDVRPTDWAYQALSNLVDKYGCVAGYPNGTYKGGQAMTRFEAAALLNACLDRVTEQTDELKRLMDEFQQELTVLRGRVDGLEKKVGKLEAMQFSTTTKFTGQATMVLGGNAFSGSAINTASNSFTSVNTRTGAASTTPLPNALSFNYDLQLNFDTSFNGRDLLRTNLRAGNFARTVFGGSPHALSLAELQIAFEQPSGANQLGLYKLFYQFPIGSTITATIGPRVGQEDLFALWPSVYPSDTILNVMTVNGAPAAYNKNLGAGAGIWWQDQSWSISANYVAFQGMNGDPNGAPVNAGTGGGGIANKSSGGSGSLQVAYQQEQWGIAAVYTYKQPEGGFIPGTTPTTHSDLDHSYGVDALTNAFGLSAYWQPWNSGWAPSVSVGWGYNTTTYGKNPGVGRVSTSQSWMVGLQWTDVLAKGNDFGMAVAQPVFATALTGGSTPSDGNYVWEWWYKVQVTDNISVTPALFYLSRPLGQRTPAGTDFSQLGALVKTTFRF
jgi:hypothetical protein